MSDIEIRLRVLESTINQLIEDRITCALAGDIGGKLNEYLKSVILPPGSSNNILLTPDTITWEMEHEWDEIFDNHNSNKCGCCRYNYPTLSRIVSLMNELQSLGHTTHLKLNVNGTNLQLTEIIDRINKLMPKKQEICVAEMDIINSAVLSNN